MNEIYLLAKNEVYLLAKIDWDDFEPVAIYETEEEAKKAADRFKLAYKDMKIYKLPFYKKVEV